MIGAAMAARHFRSALRREAWFTAMWLALSVVFGAAVVVAFDPFRHADGLRAFLGSLPAPLVAFLGIGDLASRSGFVDALLFGLFAPIAFLSFSIGFGTRAGVVDAHTPAAAEPMGVPAAAPREVAAGIVRQVAALVTGNVLLGIALAAGVLLAAAVTRAGVNPFHLVTAVAADIGLGVTFGVVGLVVAMLTGRVGLAALLATVAALVADTLNGVAPAVPALRAVRYVSLVYYAEAGRPFGRGVSADHLAVLATAVVAVIAVGAIAGTRVAHGRGATPEPA